MTQPSDEPPVDPASLEQSSMGPSLADGVEAEPEAEPRGSVRAARRGPRVSRRAALGLAGAGAVGALAGAGGTAAATRRPPVAPPRNTLEEVIRHSYSPHGKHQAGILTPQPAAARIIAWDLTETTTSALARLLKAWSGAIAALMAGRSTTDDPTPELARQSTSLAITVGLGTSVFAWPALAAQAPVGFAPLPALSRDELDAQRSDGDLITIISADDATTIAYAARTLARLAAGLTAPRWSRSGSWRGVDDEGRAVTGRSLAGPLVGSANPTGADLESAVWLGSDAPAWCIGGTTLVLRRLRIDAARWDSLRREDQERIIGRRISDGAPLTGGGEHDIPDLEGRDATGKLAIPVNAHVRLARPQAGERPLLRRVWNESDPGTSELGHVLLSYQANLSTQLVPVLRRLNDGDALADYATTVASGAYVIPPGFAPDSYLARDLLGP